MGKSTGKSAAVTRIGLDLAKNVLQLHGVDADGEVVLTRKVRRGELLRFAASLRRAKLRWKRAVPPITGDANFLRSGIR
jgi:hypothetical protein